MRLIINGKLLFPSCRYFMMAIKTRLPGVKGEIVSQAYGDAEGKPLGRPHQSVSSLFSKGDSDSAYSTYADLDRDAIGNAPNTEQKWSISDTKINNPATPAHNSMSSGTMLDQHQGASAIARATGLSRQTIYRIEQHPAAAVLATWSR